MRDRETSLGFRLTWKKGPRDIKHDRQVKGHVAELVKGKVGRRDNLGLIQDLAELCCYLECVYSGVSATQPVRLQEGGTSGLSTYSYG